MCIRNFEAQTYTDTQDILTDCNFLCDDKDAVMVN